MPKYPNLIIAGVNKGGTTSLFSYLTTHPDVCGSSIKETCFFLPTRYGEVQPPISEYAKFFSHCSGQRYVLESTPGYFYGGRAIAEALRRELGPIRILIIFRDPADRLFSFYRFMKSMLKLDSAVDMAEYVRRCNALPMAEKRRRENNPYWGVEGGYYANYLPEWFEVFEDSLKVVFFDDLKTDPVGIMRDVCHWLEIDPSVFTDRERLRVENRTMSFRFASCHRVALAMNKRGEKLFRSHPRLKLALRSIYARINEGKDQERLSPEARTWLNNLYTEHNTRLGVLLTSRGYKKLPTWLAPERAEVSLR